jgi:hypothetical protein
VTIKIPDEFWEQMERHTGPLSTSDRGWFMCLLADAPKVKARVTRSQAAKAVDELSIPAAERSGRGRPRKPKTLPERIEWAMMGKEEDQALQAAKDWIANEPPSPSRMDWQRYFLISALASAWGRRLNKASGKSLSYSRDAYAELPSPEGPFLEAVKLCLYQLGRRDSDEAIAEAIRTARDRIFAL